MNKEYDEIKDQEKKIWKDEELMFKYLFKKNIKKDSDYKKYHLIWFPLTVIFLFLFLSVMYRQIKDMICQIKLE